MVGLAFFIAIASFVGIVTFGFRVISHAKSGVRRWSGKLQYNPFNVIFHSELLTEDGLRDRRYLVLSVLCFVGIIGLAFVMKGIAQLLK